MGRRLDRRHDENRSGRRSHSARQLGTGRDRLQQHRERQPRRDHQGPRERRQGTGQEVLSRLCRRDERRRSLEREQRALVRFGVPAHPRLVRRSRSHQRGVGLVSERHRYERWERHHDELLPGRRLRRLDRRRRVQLGDHQRWLAVVQASLPADLPAPRGQGKTDPDRRDGVGGGRRQQGPMDRRHDPHPEGLVPALQRRRVVRHQQGNGLAHRLAPTTLDAFKRMANDPYFNP
jgi:hypothetical protein